MSKWYRLSLSLAAKCRLAFSAAVLLIIGSALFVPYRWMDKLVEQGKLEQARAEVQHVLERHFQPVQDTQVYRKIPPLFLYEEESNQIKTGRWTASGQGGTLDASTDAINVILSDETTAQENNIPNRVSTRWLALRLENHNQITSDVETLEEQNQNEEEISDGPENPKGLLSNFHGDPFERSGVLKFLNNRKRNERFRFFEGRGRYLRAVHADRSCLSLGCHSQPAEESPPLAETAGQGRLFNEGQLVGVISVIIPQGQTSTTLLFNRIFIVMAGVLSGICAIVTFYLITQRFILQPVRQLREAADHLIVPVGDDKEELDKEQQSWHHVMAKMQEIKTADEFERLAQAFYLMLERLKLSQDRLRESNRALDIQLGELEAKNLALYESNKFKGEFLANVSHELRTPLNAIIGFAQILQERANESGDEKSNRYIHNVLKSSRLLLGIINDLLDLAKIEAGKVELRWEQCSIREIIEALLNLTRPLVEEKLLTVDIHIDEQFGLVESDPGKIRQILFNLLSNAIKFTPSNGRIALSARRIDPDHFELQVSDSGPGIPEHDREIIFEKFRQLDASVTKEYSGTGLGLAIVKELVEILRGTITVGGKVGEGTIITVVLPLNRSMIETAASSASQPNA